MIRIIKESIDDLRFVKIREGKKCIRESNDFEDAPIVMYYNGKKIYEGDSDSYNTYRILRDLMRKYNEFYIDAKDFLENELAIESDGIEDCADSLAQIIFYDSTYADSIDSFYVPFGKFEAFFKEDEVKENINYKKYVKEGVNKVRYLPVSVGKRLGIENYPNFSASGSVSGMRKQFYGDDALLVKCGSYIYNVTDNPNIYYRAK